MEPSDPTNQVRQVEPSQVTEVPLGSSPTDDQAGSETINGGGPVPGNTHESASNPDNDFAAVSESRVQPLNSTQVGFGSEVFKKGGQSGDPKRFLKSPDTIRMARMSKKTLPRQPNGMKSLQHLLRARAVPYWQLQREGHRCCAEFPERRLLV